jgi:beta-glucanase (GH16 family)
MNTVLVLSILFASSFAEAKNQTSYHTDFSSDSVLKEGWTMSNGCAHCSHKEGHECTDDTPKATKFGAAQDGKGFTFTTTQVDKTSCGACATSGHMMWSPQLLYGNITVQAKWFPGTDDVVKTGEGYIDWLGGGNKDGVTFGFSGLGEEGKNKFKTVVYAGGRSQVREYVQSNSSLSENFNTFGYYWSKSKVIWYLNGKVVRTYTDEAHIPTVSMQLRLHSRSGDCVEMKKKASFETYFLSFSYDPL